MDQPVTSTSSERIASIVVGFDFTPCSMTALKQAIRIASKCDATVQAVHVIDTLVVMDLEAALSQMQRDIAANLTSDAQKAWREAVAGLSAAQDVALDVAIDNRIVGILRKADQHNADLLVLGAFSSQKPHVGVGTVASGCVRKSHCDVLLIRDNQVGPFKTVTAAVDFSPASSRALTLAARFAAIDGAELRVFHIFDAPWHQFHYRAPTPQVEPSFQRQYTEGLQRRLKAFASDAVALYPALRASFEVFDYSGHRSGIVEYSQRVNADLIVLGTRGRSNIRDLLIGSTAEKALRESSCSILAVKPQPRQV
jgi:universal stress protein E